MSRFMRGPYRGLSRQGLAGWGHGSGHRWASGGGVMTPSLLRGIARRPVLTFMLIGLGAGVLVLVIPPIVQAEVLPFDMPLHGVVSGVLGVGVGAFLVTYALSGRRGVADLARRSVRWRVRLRWYLVARFTVPVGATLISLVIYGPQALAAPAGGWPRVLAEVGAVFILQLLLFQLPGGDRLHRIPAAPRAGPLPPDEAHRLRGAALGVMAHARLPGRGRLGCEGAHRRPGHLRHRVRLPVLRPRPVRLVLQPQPATACSWWRSFMPASMPQSTSSPTT